MFQKKVRESIFEKQDKTQRYSFISMILSTFSLIFSLTTLSALIFILVCLSSIRADEIYSLPVPGYTTLAAVFNTPRPSKINPEQIVLHKAIDIVCDRYSPVCAAQGGEVVECYYSKIDNKQKHPLGNYVIIELSNKHRQLYAHLQTHKAYGGELISKGEFFGQAGDTGEARGCHLHFAEFDENGIAVKTTFKFGIIWKLLGNVYALQNGQ